MYSPEFEGAEASDFKIIDRTKVQEPVQVAETVTPEPVQAPIVDTPVEVATPAEVPLVDTPVEQPIQTAPPPAAQKEVTPPVVQKTWEDHLRDEGYDEKDIAMLKHRKNTGSYKDYLEAMSVNYKDMPAEEIMRRDLQEQYPTMPPALLERLYRKQVTEKYNLDPDLSPSEEDTELGKQLMSHDAEAKRQKFLEKQNAFIIPDKDITGEQKRQAEEQQRIASEQQEAFKQSIITSPVAQSLNANKSIALDAGDGTTFKYAIDNPQDVMDILLKPEKYGEAMSVKDAAGNITGPDFQKTMQLAAFAKNPQAFIKALINHGKNLGKKEYIDTLENATPNTPVTPVTGEQSLLDAFATNGRRKNW